MLTIDATALADVALLMMRVLIGVLFASSGWKHFSEPVARGESIGFSPGFTRLLGIAELVAGLGVMLGILPRLAALIIIGVMLGAIHRKMFVWKTGFWGENNDGWFHDTLYLVCALLIVATGGGALVLLA